MRQLLMALAAMAICLLIAKLLPREGEFVGALRGVFWVLAGGFALLVVVILVQAALGNL